MITEKKIYLNLAKNNDKKNPVFMHLFSNENMK